MVTHGTFELDSGSWEVDNNIWVVGDDNEVVVIDAAHDYLGRKLWPALESAASPTPIVPEQLGRTNKAERSMPAA